MENIKCPCCSENEFSSAVKLKNHMAKQEDCKHKLVIYFYKKYKMKCADILEFCKHYSTFLTSVVDEESMLKIRDMIVERNNAIKKQKAEKTEQEKLQACQQKMKLLQEREMLKQQELDLQKQFWKTIKGKDKPLELIKYFYNKIHLQSINLMIELTLVKQLYTKYCLDGDTIRQIFDYMIMIGKTDLRSVNYCISDALLFIQYKNEVDIPNTSAYFVKMFYKGIKVKCNKKNFLNEVKHIESTRISEKLSNEDILNIINGMIKDKINVLLWFSNSVVKYRKVNPIHNYNTDREINDVIQEILNGNMSLEQVPPRLLTSCTKIITDKFIKGEFDSRYNHFEFAYKVKLNLTKELYSIALNTDRQSRFEYLKTKLSNEKLTQLNIQINKFNEWVQNQPSKKGC